MILAAEKTLWLGLHTADWIVLALYFVVILAIGFWSIKKVKDMTDFFMGGRRFGKIFMMFFAFGSGTSSEQAISVVAGTWRAGLAGIWWQFLWLWATPFYWIVAPIMRRMRALTTADFFETRFNGPTAVLYSFYGIAISITFIAGGLFGTGKMVDALTGNELDRISIEANIMVPAAQWDAAEKTFSITERRLQGYEFAILAVTVMFVIYGMAGGLGAAIITDFIQGILTIIFSFLLLPFVFYQIGGFGELHKQADLKKGMLDLFASDELAATMGEPITVFYVFMLSVTALAGIVIQPHIMGVCGAGKTEYEGRFGFTVGNFLKRFCTVAWTFTGLACIIWYMGDNSPLKTSPDPADQAIYQSLRMKASPEYQKLPAEEKAKIDTTDRNFADQLFGLAAHDILPTIAPGLIGLLLASLLAAVMSTSDAQMIISSGLFTENIYRKCIVKDRSQRHYLWVGRLSGLVIVILALVLQTTFTDIIAALKVIVKTPACIGISLWFGISWRRWNVVSVWTSTVTGILVWIAVAFYPDVIYKTGFLPEQMFKVDGTTVKMLDVWQMFSFMGVAILSGVIVSFLTPRQSKEKLDHFYTLMHTPVTLNEVIESPCTLPKDPAPVGKRLFPNSKDIEIPKPTFQDLSGFILAWCAVGAIIYLTKYLSEVA
ncbi:MAG: sodium:solute symporter family protein [Gimesia sp.]|nr:sodium:solute symporter family protein [Gimesia sp.]